MNAITSIHLAASSLKFTRLSRQIVMHAYSSEYSGCYVFAATEGEKVEATQDDRNARLFSVGVVGKNGPPMFVEFTGEPTFEGDPSCYVVTEEEPQAGEHPSVTVPHPATL